MNNSLSNSSVKPLVINTRPIERASQLTQYLRAADFEVVDMPMLALQARGVSSADIQIMRQWLAGHYQALVIVSPTAAALGLAVWQSLLADEQSSTFAINESNSPSHFLQVVEAPSPIIAVGEATARVLQPAQKLTASDHESSIGPTNFKQANFAVLCPAIANNEGMLAMPEIERLQAGDKVLIWRGLGGRRLLVEALQARGVHIDSIAWYERVMPEMAVSDYQQWLQSYSSKLSSCIKQQVRLPKPIVIISSETAFEYWTSIVSQAKANSVLTLNDFSYLVLGARLAALIAAQQLTYWQVEDLSPETIMATIN